MDLDLPVRTVGRPAAPPEVDILGEVLDTDITLLQSTARPTANPPHLKRLSDRHHSVARLLAAGHKPWEVAAITGYDNARISILQADPAFQDLLAGYRMSEDSITADVAARVRDTAATAVAKLADRLESDEAIDFADLSKTAKDLLDRAGFGPKSTRDVNINVGLAERIEEARKRAIAARGEAPPMTLELEVNE